MPQQPTSSLANQMKMRDREMVPRVLVVAMFCLMGATLAIAAFARLTDQPLRGVAPDSPVVAERMITLEGTRNTGISVLDEAGNEIANSQARRSGFIDVIWNAVERKRKLARIEGNPPLKLVRQEDGRIAIIDPETRWSVKLIGYGQDNIAAFARLLN